MYDIETKFDTYIDKIYFEDFIKSNTSYKKINEYFNQEINFNLNDSRNINS